MLRVVDSVPCISATQCKRAVTQKDDLFVPSSHQCSRSTKYGSKFSICDAFAFNTFTTCNLFLFLLVIILLRHKVFVRRLKRKENCSQTALYDCCLAFPNFVLKIDRSIEGGIPRTRRECDCDEDHFMEMQLARALRRRRKSYYVNVRHKYYTCVAHN